MFDIPTAVLSNLEMFLNLCTQIAEQLDNKMWTVFLNKTQQTSYQ